MYVKMEACLSMGAFTPNTQNLTFRHYVFAWCESKDALVLGVKPPLCSGNCCQVRKGIGSQVDVIFQGGQHFMWVSEAVMEASKPCVIGYCI